MIAMVLASLLHSLWRLLQLQLFPVGSGLSLLVLLSAMTRRTLPQLQAPMPEVPGGSAEVSGAQIMPTVFKEIFTPPV